MKTKDKPHRETRKPKRQGKPYLMNLGTKEIHHVPRVTAACRIARIESFKEFERLSDAIDAGGDVCAKCIRSER